MSLIYNRYQGRWSPSGCLTVDAPNMVTAIKMLTKNKGSEPIHVLLLEEGIYVANALPQGSFTVSVLGIEPLDPNTGNNGTNAANIGWKLGNSSVLTPYSIDGESVTESTPSSNINTNQDIVGTVYPMSGTLPLGNTVILNAVPSVTGAYLFSHFTVSNPNVNGGSEEVYSIDNGKVHKVIDGDYTSYAIQFNIADGMTKVKAIFTKNPDYVDPETVIEYHINYYDVSKDTEDESEEDSSPYIGYQVAESKYNTELVYNESNGPIELINPMDKDKIDNYTIVGEGHAGLRISNVEINPKVLTDTEDNAYTSEETAPIKVSLEKYTEVTFQYNEYNKVKNEVIDTTKVSKILKCGSSIDTSTSMDAPVGTWYREVEGTDESTGEPITTYEVVTFSDWKVPYKDVTLYGPNDPSYKEPMIPYRVYYMIEYTDGKYHEYGYIDKSVRYGSNPELDTEGNLTINSVSSIPDAKSNLDISPSEDNVTTNWVFNKTEGEDIVLTDTTPDYYINSENAPKVYLYSYTKITFNYEDDREPVSKWLRYNTQLDESILPDIFDYSWYWLTGPSGGTGWDYKQIDDISEWKVPYAEHYELYNYYPEEPNTEGGEPNAD